MLLQLSKYPICLTPLLRHIASLPQSVQQTCQNRNNSLALLIQLIGEPIHVGYTGCLSLCHNALLILYGDVAHVRRTPWSRGSLHQRQSYCLSLLSLGATIHTFQLLFHRIQRYFSFEVLVPDMGCPVWLAAMLSCGAGSSQSTPPPDAVFPSCQLSPVV